MATMIDQIQTGGEAVIRMRDEFAQLAKCYIDMGDFAAAQQAAAMAKALEDFECAHNITDVEWPPRAEKDTYGRGFLAGNEETAYER